MNYKLLFDYIELTSPVKINADYLIRLATIFSYSYISNVDSFINKRFSKNLNLDKRLSLLQEYCDKFEFNIDVFNLYENDKIIYDKNIDSYLNARYKCDKNDPIIKLKKGNNIANVFTGIHELSHLYDDLMFEDNRNKDLFSETFAYQSENLTMLDLYENNKSLRNDIEMFYNNLYYYSLVSICDIIPILKLYREYKNNNNYIDEKIISDCCEKYKFDYFEYINDNKLNILFLKDNISYIIGLVYGIVFAMDNSKSTYELRSKFYTNDLNDVIPFDSKYYIKETLDDFNKKILKK